MLARLLCFFRTNETKTLLSTAFLSLLILKIRCLGNEHIINIILLIFSSFHLSPFKICYEENKQNTDAAECFFPL